jgi:outer membrane protein TolC
MMSGFSTGADNFLMPALVTVLALVPATTWGQSTRVVSLDEARAIVREENYSVQISEERVLQTELLMDSARAVLLPTVSASAAFTFNDIEVEFAFPNPLVPTIPYLDAVRNNIDPSLPDPAVFGGEAPPQVIQPRTQLTGNVVVRQTLYNARAFPLLRQARSSIAMAEMGVEQTAFQLERSVVDAYFAALGLQRFVDISRQNVELAQLSLERAEAAFEVGVGNRFDVTRAQVELSGAERNQLAAETSYQVAVAQLGLLLNQDSSFEVVAPTELNDGSIGSSVALDSFRPELRALDLQLELNEHRVREQEVLWLPTFAIQGVANVQPTTAFNPRAVRWNIALTADWQIYDSGLRRTERRRREFDVITAQLQREQLVDQLSTELDMTRLRLEEAKTNVLTAEAEVELAQENLRLLTEAQDLGAVSALDVILAQQQLFASQLALADSANRVQQQLYTIRLLESGQ